MFIVSNVSLRKQLNVTQNNNNNKMCCIVAHSTKNEWSGESESWTYKSDTIQFNLSMNWNFIQILNKFSVSFSFSINDLQKMCKVTYLEPNLRKRQCDRMRLLLLFMWSGEGDQLRKRINDIQTHVYPDTINLVKKKKKFKFFFKTKKKKIIESQKKNLFLKSPDKFSCFYPVGWDTKTTEQG